MGTMRISCCQCGAPLDVAGVGAPVVCKYCAVQNHLSYDFKTDALVLVRHQVDLLKMREDLDARIEIILSNLASINPIAQWPDGGPAISGKMMLPAGVLVAAGLCLAPFSGFGYLVLIVGVLVAIARVGNYFNLRQSYQRDYAVRSCR